MTELAERLAADTLALIDIASESRDEARDPGRDPSTRGRGAGAPDRR